jgi:hypothetical protein
MSMDSHGGMTWPADHDTGYYSVAAKVRKILSVSKQVPRKFDLYRYLISKT